MIRSQLFRNVGDEGLRKLERAVSQTPSDIATARRFAVEWRRAGRTDWPQVLVDGMTDAVRHVGEDEWEQSAAPWVKLVTVMGLDGSTRIREAILRQHETTSARSTFSWARRRPLVTTQHVYRLLLPYWDQGLRGSILNGAPLDGWSVVATWEPPGHEWMYRLLIGGRVERNRVTAITVPVHGELPALWSAISDDRVSIGFSYLPTMEGQYQGDFDRLPSSVYDSDSRVVREAWVRHAAQSPSGLTTSPRWRNVTTVSLTPLEIAHFLIEQEIEDRRPDLLAIPQDVSPTSDDVNAAVERILAEANGKRASLTISVEDVRQAVRLALEQPGISVVIGVKSQGSEEAGFSVLVPRPREGTDDDPFRYDEVGHSGFRDAMNRIAASTRRRGRGGLRITLMLVAADRDDVTISATSASGGVLGWGAAGAASHAWQEIRQVGWVRAWMFRDAPDRIRIPRSLAEDWVGQ